MAHFRHCEGLIVLLTWNCYLCIASNVTHITVNRYDKVNLKCSIAVNLSDDKLRWRHNGVFIYTGTRPITHKTLTYLEGDYSLSIRNVSLSNEGNYSCSASTYNSCSITYHLTVKGDDDTGTESSLESVTLKEAEDHSRIDSSLRGVLLITSSVIGVVIAVLILLHCVKGLPRRGKNSFRLQHDENTDTDAAIKFENFDNNDQDRVHNDQDSSSFTTTDSRVMNHGLYSSRIFKNGDGETTTEDGILKNRSLPEIPKYCDNNDKCGHYYDIREGHIRNRTFQLNDVCILTKLKFGDLYKRWTGTITINGNSSQCVVITTTSDNVNKRCGKFNWVLLVRRLLELPKDADNLVTTEGIYMDGGEICILQEHLACQTLQSLMDNGSGGKKVFTTRASEYIMGILKGMELLHSYGLLHPGLSRRKILVMSTGNCKLYDFCLSQDASFVIRILQEKLDECKLPEESIGRYEYTTESDVWSVAVVIWEILTNGLPLIFLLGGNPSATSCSPDFPEEIIESRRVLLKQCLLTEMERRPSITELRKSFEEMLPENDLQFSSSKTD